MEKHHYVFAITLFLLLSALGSPCFHCIQHGTALQSTYLSANSLSNENHPPETPLQPQGPLKGDAGKEYLYWTSATDPDDDSLFYLFDWGDAQQGSWLGPFESGANISVTHMWHQRGTYDIKVKVRDTYNAESNWSASLPVILSGPYLTLGSITGGIGLTIELKNIGENDAENVEVNLTTTNGFIIKTIPKHLQIPIIPAGDSIQEEIRLWGIGFGIFTDLPKVTITLQAPYAKTRGKQVEVRLLGPFVKKVGESWSTDESYKGYTLYSPMMSKETFLINNSGAIVHSWTSSYKPALSVYLLETGNILRTAFPGHSPRFWGGGIGGVVEMFHWNGTRTWSFQYSTSQECLHHDVKMLPNGNILMIAWEYRTKDEAIFKGRNPNNTPQGGLWPDHLIEVQPTNDSGGIIVWEWHVWDHLIQDFDPTKENYGVVQDHPELVDINYGGRILSDWTHINSVDYNQDTDQILLSVLLFDEIWIIDHSTTTEEAAGHTGGRSGKGGDLLYRWGNPLTYRSGTDADRKLFNQHDAGWIPPGRPGSGNILIFNNGLDRPGEDYSSIEEIVPPMDANGYYSYTPGTAYGPTESIWNFTAEKPTEFYAINLGGAQRLPNGNTLICDGPHGRFFEVTKEKEVVWEFTNQVPDPLDSHVFKIHRYAPEYPGVQFP
ncbi:MAG: aryl-sulfate sulfotransferase [Candidatus Thermoplasmatota archaeon]|nr:aryl-sulfate sulfotransferase [Candidatus Thermoplasmatota archaeon]